MKNKLAKTLTTRLFVALIVLSVVGWIILFGKNLPQNYTPVVYAVIALTFIASLYVYWKKPEVLQNKKTVIFLAFFILIGAVGWMSSFSEITGCRPYKCGAEEFCARPAEFGLRITTGECSSEFPGAANISCIETDGACMIKKLCNAYTTEDCPEDCVVCPPCEVCSMVSCQTEEFCRDMGFNRTWWETVRYRPSDPPV